MRNPERIAPFLLCIEPYEGEILTNDTINQVVKNVIGAKLYETMYQKKTYKNICDNPDLSFTDTQLDDIVKNSPQSHKEANFDKGWPSRFDTWYKLPMELGFLYYEMGKPVVISEIGKMLIDAVKQQNTNSDLIHNVFLNSMVKYQRKNPFRKVLNDNVPLILLLNVLNKLKENNSDSTGIYRQEISFFICWPNNNADELYDFIVNFRNKYKIGQYSDEIIYEECLTLLKAKESDKNYYKMEQITGEAVDEYIRKMRITGVLSLRGNGRFLDFNTFEMKKIKYVLDQYKTYTTFSDKKQYFEYIGGKDANILGIEKSVDTIQENDVRKATLLKFARQYDKEKIFDELRNLCQKRESKDQLLRFMSAPARFEFLASIALVQNFDGLDVCPNYCIDDEGLPTNTALGNVSDIICKENDSTEALVEVTLMRGRSDQINNEMIPIDRHLEETKNAFPDAFAIFVAPIIHKDVYKFARFAKFDTGSIIIPYDINEFIENISSHSKLRELAISA